MALKVPEKYRLAYHPIYGVMDASNGNNGVFILPVVPSDTNPGAWELTSVPYAQLVCIVADGMGWEHVSVTTRHAEKHTSVGVPTHEMMCLVKSVFWDDEDTVMHLYPPKSEYVNNHAFCLHLWRPSPESGLEISRPPSIMVGFTDKEVSEKLSHHARMTLESLRRDQPRDPIFESVRAKPMLKPLPLRVKNNILRGKK